MGGGGGANIRIEERGTGVWDPKICVPQVAQSDFPDGHLLFQCKAAVAEGGRVKPNVQTTRAHIHGLSTRHIFVGLKDMESV